MTSLRSDHNVDSDQPDLFTNTAAAWEHDGDQEPGLYYDGRTERPIRNEKAL